MPWKESNVQEERIKFVAAWKQGGWTMTDLCYEFGISRKTGYKYIERYNDGGVDGLKCQSRARKFHPNATRPELVDLVIEMSWLTVQVRAIYEQSGRRFRSPKVFQALRQRGIPCSHKTVEKIMKTSGIQGVSRKRRAPRTTDSRHNRPVAPNLLQRDFRTSRANGVWVSDITYSRARLYLCVVVDLYSRKIVGWSLADHMRTELVVAAFRQAWINRWPSPGLIFHSDRGSQYASEEFCGVLQSHGFEDEHDAYRYFFSYIEIFYNRKRSHSYLNYLSPSEFEEHEAA